MVAPLLSVGDRTDPCRAELGQIRKALATCGAPPPPSKSIYAVAVDAWNGFRAIPVRSACRILVGPWRPAARSQSGRCPGRTRCAAAVFEKWRTGSRLCRSVEADAAGRRHARRRLSTNDCSAHEGVRRHLNAATTEMDDDAGVRCISAKKHRPAIGSRPSRRYGVPQDNTLRK